MKRYWPKLMALCGLALATAAVPAQDEPFLVLASTTSTENSGLLDFLLPRFKEDSGISVRVVAVGTGQALRLAGQGDADVLMVHHRKSEDQFVADGLGVRRYPLMHNDFVLIGPASDPAGAAAAGDVKGALAAIAATGSSFVSRGDDSGTHKKELDLWSGIGIDTAAASGNWYREAGAGMGATLNTAVAMGGYVLSDRATWVRFGNKGEHRVLVEGDPVLFNPYGVILVSPERFRHVKAREGQAFIDWLVSPRGQGLIADFRVEGRQVFFPDARSQPED